MNFCPSCGASVVGQRFCGNCGAAVSGSGDAAAQSSGTPDGSSESSGSSWQAGDGGQAGSGYGGPVYAAPEYVDEEPRRSRVAAILVGVGVVVVLAIALAVWQLTRPSGPAPTQVAATSSPTSTGSTTDTPAPTSTSATATSTAPATPTSRNVVTATVTRVVAPSPDPEVVAAARRIDALLSESAGQRALVVGSVTCRSDPDEAVDHLDEALMGRNRLLGRIDDAPFDALPHGGEMSYELSQAWLLSKYADQNFLEWASDRRDSGQCSLTTEAYRAGVAQSQTAQRHKKAFAALWEKHVRAPLKLATKRTSANI